MDMAEAVKADVGTGSAGMDKMGQVRNESGVLRVPS